jgi:hypothetical protein
MNLIDDVKTVLLKSWSVRFSALAAILGTLAQFQAELPVLQGLIPSEWYELAAVACALGATLSRVIKQESISGPKA